MWLNLCADAGLCGRSVIASLADEADQLLRILTASQLTAKRRNQPFQPPFTNQKYSPFLIPHSSLNPQSAI